jgi:hypothetical protein
LKQSSASAPTRRPESSKKASHKGKKGKKRPGTKSTARVPKKVHFKKHCNLCKKHGGACTTHNTCDCRRFEKDRKEKSKICAAKKGGKKANPVKQNFARLTEKIEKLEKALKKSSKKGRKCQYADTRIAIPTLNRELGWVELGKEVKLGEAIEKMKFPPPSPIKSTLTTIASDSNDVSMTSVGDAGDVMMMSPSQNKESLNTNSILLNKDPPEGKTTAIIAVMRDKPKHGHHQHRSNKHYKQKLVRVLLDSGSDGNLVFVN